MKKTLISIATALIIGISNPAFSCYEWVKLGYFELGTWGNASASTVGGGGGNLQ